jgi:hypothetical protein
LRPDQSRQPHEQARPDHPRRRAPRPARAARRGGRDYHERSGDTLCHEGRRVRNQRWMQGDSEPTRDGAPSRNSRTIDEPMRAVRTHRADQRVDRHRRARRGPEDGVGDRKHGRIPHRIVRRVSHRAVGPEPGVPEPAGQAPRQNVVIVSILHGGKPRAGPRNDSKPDDRCDRRDEARVGAPFSHAREHTRRGWAARNHARLAHRSALSRPPLIRDAFTTPVKRAAKV